VLIGIRDIPKVEFQEECFRWPASAASLHTVESATAKDPSSWTRINEGGLISTLISISGESPSELSVFD
jgi:hypothetical protein